MRGNGLGLFVVKLLLAVAAQGVGAEAFVEEVAVDGLAGDGALPGGDDHLAIGGGNTPGSVKAGHSGGLMGIDLDLDRAMRRSVTETVKFLVEEKGLTPAKAFSLASLAVDFQVAEAVDFAQLVSARIPKSVFLSK